MEYKIHFGEAGEAGEARQLLLQVLVGITFGMYVCMLFMVQHGRYSACYVPRQNVTDDGRYSGPTVDDLQVLFDLFGMRPSLE